MPRFRDELKLDSLLPTLTAGFVAGSLVIVLQISFATLIFSGELSTHLSYGIGMTLFGAFVMGTVAALTSSFPGVIVCLQGSPAVILALMAGAIVTSMSASGSTEDIFVTVVATIGLTSLFAGVLFWTLGWLRLGRLIRFVPYPVSGGFLAGTGLLLVIRAMRVMTGSSLDFSHLPGLFQSHLLIRWGPGVIFAVALLIVGRRFSHYMITPAAVAIAIVSFYVVLLLSGTTITEASAKGLLLGPFAEGSAWRPLSFSSLNRVHWLLVFGQAWQLGTILVVSSIALLLNAGGLELVVRRDIDLNRELRSTGLANILSGVTGGPIGYLTMSLSALGHKMGSTSRLAGLFSAALCGVVLCFGTSLLSFLPRSILGGLLFFLGLSFLVEWTYDAWFKIPRADYVIVLLILFVIGTRGFLDGVATGLLIAVVLFVVKYSGIDVVKQTLSGANSTSNVDRPVEHRRLLRETGEKLSILRLQGYIFFGTAHNLYRTISLRTEDPDRPRLGFVLLDFTRVTGLDSSAAICFLKIIQLAQSSDFQVVFTNMTPELKHQLDRTVFSEENEAVYRIFPDQDYGIEWCENQILIAENVLPTEGEQPLFAYLEESFPKTVDVGRIMIYLEKKDVAEGFYLMHQAEASEDLYFIESGQVNALISTSEGVHEAARLGPEDGRTVRLRAMRPGTVVGEVSMYLGVPRTASAVTTQPSTLYRLSSEALREMERREPELASAFHQFIARLLAERLSDNARTIRALSD